MELEYTTKSRATLKQLGFDVQQRKVTYRAKLLVMLSMYLCAQAIASTVNNWKNLIVRFQSIEHSVITLISSLIFFHYVIDPGRIEGLLSLAEERYFQYERMAVAEEEEIFKKNTINEINSGALFVEQLLQMETILVISTPLMYIIYMTLITGKLEIQSIQFDQLPLPFSYGQKCTNIFTYSIVFIIQSLFMNWFVKISCCMYSSILFATKQLVSEVKLLAITLNRFDIQLKVVQTKISSSNLKMILRQIVANHNLIYRKYKILNNKVSVTITMVNYTLAFLICLSVFSFIKVNNKLSRLKYCAQITVCVMVLHMYSGVGQDLANEGERISESLAHFSWYDKPEWFKKSLLFMLTRAQKRLEIKPFGMYVLDLRNFSVVMNAAYSYFNLLNKFS